MAGFLTSLAVSLLDGSDSTWTLDSALVYSSNLYEHVIIVPEGFTTDFASVPRLPLSYLFFGDTAHAAAVVHDYLYGSRTVSKTLADRIFLEAMGVSGIPAWRRYPMFLAVSLFGGFAYSKTKAVSE